MNILERIKEFASWDEATQQACIQYASESKKSPAKLSRQATDERWSNEDRDWLMEQFALYEWDKTKVASWAKRLGRTELAIRAQWDKEFKKGQK
jgi:hypothetical protein